VIGPTPYSRISVDSAGFPLAPPASLLNVRYNTAVGSDPWVAYWLAQATHDRLVLAKCPNGVSDPRGWAHLSCIFQGAVTQHEESHWVDLNQSALNSV